MSQSETSDSGEADGDNYLVGTVQMPLTRSSGDVIGNQVRLRKGPDSTALTLETMNFGEIVFVDKVTSANVPTGQWLYVKRMKTGTWGWVLREHIYIH